MSDNSTDLRPLKIEEPLPVTAVGIESVKEGKPQTMSSHRRIYPWFARRPTAATRLAILSSVLPADVSTEKLLKFMCMGPRTDVDDIEEYIIQKRQTESERGGSIEEHYGYKYPHRQTPSESELSEFHSLLREQWDGSLPTVLDPTAGGGTIPLEAFRYGLPTVSNELNPVAWLINKVLLDYAPSAGTLEGELETWANEIEQKVSDRLTEYYPTKNGVDPNHYFRTYSIDCTSCGERFPLTNQWWFNRKQNRAVEPQYETVDGKLKFRCIKYPEEATSEDFNPDSGTIEGGEATCPHCNVVIERNKITEIFQNGEFEYEVGAVRYTKKINGTYYHSVSDDERSAIRQAEQTVENTLDYATLLTRDRYIGRQDRAAPYGITQWRDFFTPRQLLSHATFLEVFEDVRSQIEQDYDAETAEPLLVLLAFSSTRLLNRNTRLQPLNLDGGSPLDLLGNNNFAFKWHFGETNPLAGTYSYAEEAKKVRTHYQTVARQVADRDSSLAKVLRGDAADLPIGDDSVEAVVIDPPYGSNIMYAEMSDILYVWLREYLGDIFGSAFSSPETNKQDEAVENTAIVDEEESKSKDEIARQKYQNKMGDILSTSYNKLKPGGVITIYFTDRDTETWDALTMSIINAGFVITATHTITSEVPKRIAMKDRGSADSTLLLTCRKPIEQTRDEGTATLWADIREKTKKVAREEAEELLDSSLNLTKTDTIISAFGPTLRVFTESYPVVDKHDEIVRPNRALEEARTAVVEIILQRELGETLDDVDSLTKWYVACWLVHEKSDIPFDDANQLGHGVGVDISDIKNDTKIWGKSKDTLILKGQSYRVRDYTALEAGEKRRKRAYPIDPHDVTFDQEIDAVHATLNVLQTKGSDFAWNWINERGLQDSPSFKQTIKSLVKVLPKDHEDYELLINLASGETAELLNIDSSIFQSSGGEGDESRTTLEDF